MFSNLDNFLNGQNNFTAQQNDLPDTSFSNAANDSWDLDLSVKANDKGKKIVVEDDDNVEMGSKFVPAKGQITAAKRLKKIGDTLASNLVETQKQQNAMERRTKKVNKKSPTKKQSNKNRRRRSLRKDFDHDSSDSSSDSDMLIRLSGRQARLASRQVHDPNTIVLDCDDEFFGGPAVNFTRNLATASAISMEDNMDLKVSVRISGKIESFHMNTFQKLSTLIAQISEKHKVTSDHVTLMFKDKTVSEQETPNSIGYVQGLIIKAHITDTVNKRNAAGTMANADGNKLEIKIQTDGRKRPFITYIGRTDQLITLAFSCAEEFKCDVEKVAIEFDGEFINFKQTPEDLDLEGGELMDFFLKKT